MKKLAHCVYFTDSICDDDWNYFRGYCYRQVAACDSWGSSQGKRRELTFQAYTARKKTFMSRVCMAESTLG